MRLAQRRDELETEVLTRVYGIEDPARVGGQPHYAEGLRQAISAALDYGFAAIAGGRPPEVPPKLLAQARLAARSGVSLETVVRRYSAGQALLWDRTLAEAQAAGTAAEELRRLHRAEAGAFDRLLAAVSEEYGREVRERPKQGERRRAELVERLLAGELLDHSELGYELADWHLALLLAGPGIGQAARDLASRLDRRLLLIEREVQLFWVWLGGRERLGREQIASLDCHPWPAETRVAVGEPGQGLPGWRLSHRQAAKTLPLALRAERRVVHFADSPLLASALLDDLLATTLRQLYLEPLARERDGGATAKKTLRAYLAAGGNASSAAAALGVNRRTVSSRLAAIEERLGRAVDTAYAEIETALRLDEIEGA